MKNHPVTFIFRAILPTTFIATVGFLHAAEVHITVDTSSTVNTMRGGIGASWHAIEKPISTTRDTVFKMHDHGGSGWGANPPAEDKAAWNQIYRHASWLGMDFIRVELEQRMYEPRRKAFDWDNPEMRILYRILDWCQENNVDVFLTQMWSNVEWNAFPEFRDNPAHIVHSGPYSMDDFAEGLATCVEHLVKTKKYTCIRHLCITNEPCSRWSWWNKPPNVPMLLTPGLEAVRKALDKRGLDVPLIGPDTVFIPDPNSETIAYSDVKRGSPLLGAYDFHWYDDKFDFDGGGRVISSSVQRLAAWAKLARSENKGLYVGELGTRAYGDTSDWSNPGVTSFPVSIFNAECVVRGIAVGVDGFNRWSFINRGDLDGQYQMIDTWDIKKKKLLTRFPPHANIYYVYGMLSRFTAKHSHVLSCQVEGGDIGKHRRVFAMALESPRRALTLAVVNDAPKAWNLSVQLDGLKKPARLYRYEVSQKDADLTDLTIEPEADVEVSAENAIFSANISPMSLTIYTTYKLSHNEKGVIAE
ncbi:MAG: hypothetical protein JXM70_18860 [Pirellulales bacterium]|nr:hypothetical protein [Pirellulales bacterium]